MLGPDVRGLSRRRQRRNAPLVLLRFRKASLVHQVTDALRREIEGGTCRGWLPTERALCEQLHVSRRTVRCALEQLKKHGLLSAHVGVGTKVMAIPTAASHSSAADATVGLLMPEPIDLLRPYVTLWIDLLKTELFDSGVALRVHAGPQYFRRGSGNALRRLVDQHPHACWILALSNSWVQQWFRDNRLTAIVAGMPEPELDLPAVCLDSGALGRHIAGRMLALGHERVVMLSGPRPSPGCGRSRRWLPQNHPGRGDSGGGRQRAAPRTDAARLSTRSRAPAPRANCRALPVRSVAPTRVPVRFGFRTLGRTTRPR
jgi:hypothetical protein